MNFSSNFFLDFGEEAETYFSLLSNEDFDFKTKNILVKVTKEGPVVSVRLECDCVLDLKIASSSIIRSLEVIKKTISV